MAIGYVPPRFREGALSRVASKGPNRPRPEYRLGHLGVRRDLLVAEPVRRAMEND